MEKQTGCTATSSIIRYKAKVRKQCNFGMFQGVREHCEVQAGPHAQEDGDRGERRHKQEQFPVH